MIMEWLKARLTPASPMARKLGFVDELIAIEARFKRQAAHWTTHQDQCKNAIAEASLRLPRHNRVVVLGSGPCLDVPLKSLERNFEEVMLVDVVHPRWLHKQLGDHPNVTLVEDDLSGVLSAVAAGQFLKPPRKITSSYLYHADLVISLNLWSQLATIPRNRALQAGCEERLVDDWAAQILAQHLELITQLPSPSLLITDFARDWLGPDQEIVETEKFLALDPLGPPQKSWTWACAPVGEFQKDLGFTNHVGLWQFKGTKQNF